MPATFIEPGNSRDGMIPPNPFYDNPERVSRSWISDINRSNVLPPVATYAAFVNRIDAENPIDNHLYKTDRDVLLKILKAVDKPEVLTKAIVDKRDQNSRDGSGSSGHGGNDNPPGGNGPATTVDIRNLLGGENETDADVVMADAESNRDASFSAQRDSVVQTSGTSPESRTNNEGITQVFQTYNISNSSTYNTQNVNTYVNEFLNMTMDQRAMFMQNIQSPMEVYNHNMMINQFNLNRQFGREDPVDISGLTANQVQEIEAAEGQEVSSGTTVLPAEVLPQAIANEPNVVTPVVSEEQAATSPSNTSPSVSPLSTPSSAGGAYFSDMEPVQTPVAPSVARKPSKAASKRKPTSSADEGGPGPSTLVARAKKMAKKTKENLQMAKNFEKAVAAVPPKTPVAQVLSIKTPVTPPETPAAVINKDAGDAGDAGDKMIIGASPEEIKAAIIRKNGAATNLYPMKNGAQYKGPDRKKVRVRGNAGETLDAYVDRFIQAAKDAGTNIGTPKKRGRKASAAALLPIKKSKVTKQAKPQSDSETDSPVEKEVPQAQQGQLALNATAVDILGELKNQGVTITTNIYPKKGYIRYKLADGKFSNIEPEAGESLQAFVEDFIRQFREKGRQPATRGTKRKKSDASISSGDEAPKTPTRKPKKDPKKTKNIMGMPEDE